MKAAALCDQTRFSLGTNIHHTAIFRLRRQKNKFSHSSSSCLNISGEFVISNFITGRLINTIVLPRGGGAVITVGSRTFDDPGGPAANADALASAPARARGDGTQTHGREGRVDIHVSLFL